MSLFSQLSAAAYMDRPCISAVVTAKKEGWFDDKLLAAVTDQWQRSRAIILFVREVLRYF